MITIAKTFDFDAAHWLPHVAKNHKCHRMHGHTYRVEILCRGEVDKRGMVYDYAEIAEAWSVIHGIIDHRTLNTINGLSNPTAELLAPWILKKMRVLLPARRRAAEGRKQCYYAVAEVFAVRVYESSTTWCEAVFG